MDDDKRRRHDLFNLTGLPVVCAANLYFLSTGSGERIQFILFFIYMMVDSFWVWTVPESVASASTILIHHVVVSAVWLIPFYLRNASLVRYSSYGPLVEINTFFLIARRNFKDSVLLQFMFFASWIVLRVLFYPYILIHFVAFIAIDNEHMNVAREPLYVVTAIAILGTMLLLNTMNAKWSYDLFRKTFSRSPKDNNNKFL